MARARVVLGLLAAKHIVDQPDAARQVQSRAPHLHQVLLRLKH